MAKYKVPSQAGSGADTFSDNLVGNQITTGSNQMTGTNFAIEKAIPEKDSKEFITEPFSDFVTLEDVTQDETTTSTNGSNSTSGNSGEIKFNSDKNNADRSLYGSLSERLRVAIQGIIIKFPAGVYVDGNTPTKSTSYTAEDIIYSVSEGTTSFKIQTSLFNNPFGVVMTEPKSNAPIESENEIRNFYSAFNKYVVEVDGKGHRIITYTEPDSDNYVNLKVGGLCFSGATGYTENYIIKPYNGVIEQFFDDLDEVQTVLLNRTSDPIYNAGFDVPKDTNSGSGFEIVTVYENWPLSRDGWNIQIEGVNYGAYIDKLSSLGDEIDQYKSDLVVRFLTSPQLYEFDTEDKKIESIFQIYGQSFDEVKTFIDNIAYMRNVTYDGVNNLPNRLLKNLCEVLGMSSVSLFDEKTLEQALYTRYNTQYDAISTGTNLVEAEYEFYRRLLVNLAQLYKSKGTRKAIIFFLKFIGAPEPIIRVDEYTYQVNGELPSKNVEDDISDAMLGIYVSNHMAINSGTSEYELIQVTGSTDLTRDEYPVDENTGLPRKIKDPSGDVFFQKGAGWYRKTLDHRSPDILDKENSDLTSRVKTIKTKSKPFTYGEDYFDVYRQLPGLDYGYDLRPVIDNKKSEVIESESDADLTMNRKNINVFLSADRAIDYDIYRKSRNIPTSFGPIGPQSGVTFAEFLEDAISEGIHNTNMVKYDKFYTGLTQVYYEYQNSVGFTPYHYINVQEFINRLSPYWMNIVEQFVPATTLWIGGNLSTNGEFNRSKFNYRRPVWFDVEAPSCDFGARIDLIILPSVTPSPTPTRTPTPTPTTTPAPTSLGQPYTVETSVSWQTSSTNACTHSMFPSTTTIYLAPQYADPIAAAAAGNKTFYEDANLTITWTPSSPDLWAKIIRQSDSAEYAVNIGYSDYIEDAVACSTLPTPTPTVTPSTSHIPAPVITLWAVGGDYVSKSTNEGASWTQVYDTGGQYLRSVSFLDANEGFAFGGSKAYKTLNGGTSWFDNTSSLPDIIKVTGRLLYGATHELSTDIYVGGNLSTFIRYNGSTWSDVSKGTSHNAYNLYAHSSSTVLSTTSITGAADYGLRTTNSGGSWSEPATFPQDKTVLGVDFNGANGIMCSSANTTIDKIFRSTNSGATWTAQNGLTVDAMRAVAFPTSSVAYIAGGDQSGLWGHIWKSTNGGVSWTDISGNLPASTRRINTMRFFDENKGWIGTNFNKIAYTLDGGASWSSLIDADIGSGNSVLDIMMIVEYI